MVNKKLVWKFKLNEITEEEILEYEEKFNLIIPNQLKDILREHNGCVVEPNRFDIKNSKGKVLASFISFSKRDAENAFVFTEILRKNKIESLIPFAMDPFGNYLCINDNKVFYLNNETNETIFLNDSIQEFLDSLY